MGDERRPQGDTSLVGSIVASGELLKEPENLKKLKLRTVHSSGAIAGRERRERQPQDYRSAVDSIAVHGEMLKELRAFLDSSGGLGSLPVVPDEGSRRLLQRLPLDKRRLAEVEERMKQSPEALAYFTEMHWRLEDLFVGAQALGSGKVQPAASMPFVSVVLNLAQHMLSELPILKTLVGGAHASFQAWDGARVCSAAKRVCRVAPAGLAQNVAHAVALGLALGREEVVRVLWGGATGISLSVRQMVRQRWGVPMGLSQREARVRGLVEDDLARILESMLAREVQGVFGDTDGVEVSRQLIDVGFQSKASPAAMGAMPATTLPFKLGRSGPKNAVGGVVAEQRLGSSQATNSGSGCVLESYDVMALHDRIRELELKQLEHDAEVRRLRSDLSRSRGAGPRANPRGKQGDGMLLSLQANGADEARGVVWELTRVQRQLNVHQATLVQLQSEAELRGQRASIIKVRLERDSRGCKADRLRWFEGQVRTGFYDDPMTECCMPWHGEGCETRLRCQATRVFKRLKRTAPDSAYDVPPGHEGSIFGDVGTTMTLRLYPF